MKLFQTRFSFRTRKRAKKKLERRRKKKLQSVRTGGKKSEELKIEGKKIAKQEKWENRLLSARRSQASLGFRARIEHGNLQYV